MMGMIQLKVLAVVAMTEGGLGGGAEWQRSSVGNLGSFTWKIGRPALYRNNQILIARAGNTAQAS